MIRPILDTSSKGSAVMRMKTGGRLDFWTLENSIAGRGRRYHRIVIDEAAFTKDGDNKTDGSMMELWEKSIKPTLYDYGGEVLGLLELCRQESGQLLLQYLHRPHSMASKNSMPPPWTIRCFRSACRTKPSRTGWNVEPNFSMI